MDRGLIINFVPTGMIPTREMTPHVPLSPAEIAEQVLEAASLGATMAHLHARDLRTGAPTHEPEVYARIIAAIRRHDRELVICVSTSGRNVSDVERRAAVLDLDGDLRPDMGSLTLSSLNFNRQASVSSPDTIHALAHRMRERGIRPEMEVFDTGMINYARYMLRKGLVEPPCYFNLILGNIACAQADMFNLGVMLRDLPEWAEWSAGGVGDHQLEMNALAIAGGGGVRVGLEDNIWFDRDRTRLATNRELIERVVDIARACGRRPCSAAETRARLGL